ncbi:hypothetical protein GCM10011514_25770 [Emticicia aquatilis]|uniref:Uncharacterized protein n=1 Tax=Emticicia aquatilis TaxID=1537369 RepID=A0A917DQQ6_9BACT|nr:DUF6804 family protein [Emticicia aquatilis]GGD60676.1 hypothetical protein GCM10011514_25770 [Emticicia aquatilis]
MDKIIKLALSILLLLCLFKMPYGFYQFVRFLALIGFGYLAFDSNQQKKDIETIIYIVLAILFQPLIKISLGRTLWNTIDLIVGIGLILNIFGVFTIKNK